MPLNDRRLFLRNTLAAAVAVSGVPFIPGKNAQGQATDRRWPEPITDEVNEQALIEQAWAFCRAWYGYWDDCDTANWLSLLLNSSETVLQDAVVNHTYHYAQIVANFPSFFTKAASLVGRGHVTKLFHVTGDLRYGMVTEHVFLKDVFYATNGYTTHSVLDMDHGKVARTTDYWDSRELGESDLVGPTLTGGVVQPFGTVHPGGTPLFASTPTPPGDVALATGITGLPSAAPELLDLVQRFHEALESGSVPRILSFFLDDAVYVNPLIHQGPVLYGNFDQTIQIRGKRLIERFFSAVLDQLPDCRNSKLLHVVGGSPGGGFEWQAGGLNAQTGIDRTGLKGSTALDLFGGKIRRMSVKFDTYQLKPGLYEQIRSALAANGVVDPKLS